MSTFTAQQVHSLSESVRSGTYVVAKVADALSHAADDMERLDWVIRSRTYIVMGNDERGWAVMDVSNGLSIVTREHKTYRGAIDAARIKLMKKEGA